MPNIKYEPIPDGDEPNPAVHLLPVSRTPAEQYLTDVHNLRLTLDILCGAIKEKRSNSFTERLFLNPSSKIIKLVNLINPLVTSCVKTHQRYLLEEKIAPAIVANIQNELTKLQKSCASLVLTIDNKTSGTAANLLNKEAKDAVKNLVKGIKENLGLQPPDEPKLTDNPKDSLIPKH